MEIASCAFVTVTSEPNIVQSVNAKLRLSFSLTKRVAAGGYIRIEFPIDEMKVSTQITNCQEDLGQLTILKCSANVEKNYLEFILQDSIELIDSSGTDPYEFSADKAITLGTTNKTVENIYLTTSTGEGWPTTFLTEIGALTQGSLTPADQTVGADTALLVDITIAHRIPKRGKLQIGVTKPWNEGAAIKIDYFSSVTCSEFTIGGTTVTSGSYVCSFLGGNRVEIDGGFKSNDIAAGTRIKIRIAGFRSPIEANVPYDGFSIYTTGEDETHVVDYIDATVMATKPAVLTAAVFEVSPTQEENIGIVQEQNTMRLKFSSPVPLKIGCTVSYWFPHEYYDASEITSIRTGSLFAQAAVTYYPVGSGQSPTFTVAEASDPEYKSVTFSSCATFRQQRPEATTIFGLTHPQTVKETISLHAYIYDAIGETIAYFDSGVTFTPSAGPMNFVSSSLDTSTVYADAEMTFTIRPSHGLMAVNTPSLTIELPSDYKVKGTCSVSTTGAYAAGRTCSTNVIQNSVTINKIIDTDFAGGNDLTFKISKVQLPGSSAGGQGEFRFTTYEFDFDHGDKRYAVDTMDKLNVFTITKGGFESATATSSSPDALVKAEITLSFTPTHLIPKYGLVMVQYPSQLVIEDPSLSQKLCNTWVSFPSSTPVCTVFKSNRTIIVSKGFQAGAGGAPPLTKYSFKVPYFTNPPTLVTTDSFIISTLDQDFALIDKIESGITLTMVNPATFKSSELVLDSYQNTVRTRYTFTVVATASVQTGNVFLITVPPECKLPEQSSELACESTSTTYFSRLSCSKFNATSVLVRLTLKKTIPALETFSFSVNKIMNPNSTYESGVVRVQIYQSDAVQIVLNEDTKEMTIVTSIPHSVSNANLTSSVTGAGLATTYTLNMVLEHNIPKNGGILVRYPPEVVVNDEIKVQIDASDYGYYPKLSTPDIDYSARQILFADQGFGSTLVVDSRGGQALRIIINGLSNPYNNEASSSFEIVTFSSEDGVLYFIDQVVQGLTVNSLCSYPCKNCLASNPTHCTSCFLNSAMAFLQENTCLSECSDGLYYDTNEQKCKLCDPSCLTCQGTNKTCTSCGIEPYLLLNPDTHKCVTSCETGYIDDPSNNMCLRCKTGCASCSRSVNNCTTCEPTGGTSFYFDFECLPACPNNISIPSGRRCLPCDPSCKTCSGTVKTCTSCESYMRFDTFNNDCLEVCKPDEQIYIPESGLCETCQKDCQTCVGNVDTCTKCKEGFVLNTDSTCKRQCNGQKGQTAVNAICKECEEPCKTCDGKVDQCTTCIDNFLLYSGTCVDHCPDKYEPNNATINQCVLVGLICPEGFHVNAAGEGCVPNEFECKPGYVINEKRTACIPGPGSPVPFPFIFLSICMGVVVLGSNMKEKSSTKVYTCLIFLIGSLELLEYFLIAIFASMLELTFTALLASIAVISLIGSNVAFTGWYKRITMADKGFAGWIRLFPKTRFLMPLITGCLNFKSVRFLFSGFYGMDNCMANFDDPMSSIHQHLKMLTYFQFVFVYAPIYLADLIIFSKIGWGHQVLVLAWETFILQTAMIVMTQLEFKDPERLYTEGETEYTALKPKKNGQVAVMSAYEDEGMDETNLVRKDKNNYDYEIELRKRALTAILQQVGKNFLQTGEIQQVFTKFNQKQIKIRRAFSFQTIQKGWVGTSGTRDESEYSDSTIQSDDSKYHILTHRRFSFPSIEQPDEDTYFRQQFTKIKKAVIEEKYRDNVYAIPKRKVEEKQHVRKKKMVNRRTQTYLRELLQLEDERLQDSDMEIVMEEEAEIDDQYTKGLINGVLDGISEGDDSGKKKKKKKKKEKGPYFELADIMGEFEIDDAGNYIILRGEQGELLDRRERPVNKRGYLVDKAGNVINQKGKIIFKQPELDSDEEIPAQFGFEKRKQNLLSLSGDEQQFQVNTYGQGPGKVLKDPDESENEEDIVEKQFLRLKHGESSGVDDSRSQIAEPLVGNKNYIVDENGNFDEMIDIITKKTVPVKKEKISKKSKGLKVQNPPPKRLGDQLFVSGQMSEVQQQQKLKKIAESIGGFASQVAATSNFEVRSNSLANQNSRMNKDFYNPMMNDASQSVLSQENLQYINEGMALRPKNKVGPGPGPGPSDSSSLKKVYGNSNKMVAPRLSTSPGMARIKPERVSSGDPRLKGLESIYMNKFNKVGSQKNIGLKKPFQAPKKGFDDPDSQRQIMVAETIDRLQQEYLAQTANDGFYQKLE